MALQPTPNHERRQPAARRAAAQRRQIDRAGRLSEAPAGPQRRGTVMEVVVLPPLVALIAGILILIVPRLLNYIVAIYLILIGLLGLFGHYSA
jgi:Protein of unknown function (DUF3096)